MAPIKNINICQIHSELLKQQIKDFGLAHLINSVDEMSNIVQRALEDTYDSIDDFDPYLMVTYAVMQNAIKTYGSMYILRTNEMPCCPLCEHAIHNGDTKEWIDTVTIQTYVEARRLGLAPTIQ